MGKTGIIYIMTTFSLGVEVERQLKRTVRCYVVVIMNQRAVVGNNVYG